METSKRRPTIAIDVDGVLRNNLGIMVDLYNDKMASINHKELAITPDDVKVFKVEESFPLLESMLFMKPSDFFFQQHAKEVFLDAPAYPNVKECIYRLKDVADVIIVTYQKGYQNKRYALEWLEKNGIDPNGICFLRDKTLVHADALIDDNDWNFLGTHCPTSVLVTQPYNENVVLDELITKTNSKQIIRVDSLEDFTEKYFRGDIVL